MSKKEADAILWPSRGILVPVELAATVPADELVLLGFLMKYDNDGDWFICTMKKIQKVLGISKNQHSRLFKRLLKRGYIETRIEGLPGRRQIRINGHVIIKEIAATL